MSGGWIGVDFDGTLAKYEGWNDGKLGEPVPEMLERVRRWLIEGRTVKIFTARVAACGKKSEVGVDNSKFAFEQRQQIQEWCLKHLGVVLEVTATKDFAMIELWDDRAVQVEMNRGVPVGYSTRELA